MRHRLSSLCSIVVVLGCSSSNFDVGTPATPDANAEDGAQPSDGSIEDSLVEEGGGADTREQPSDAPCSPLDLEATTFYVDGLSARASVGTADCPAKTIGEVLRKINDLKPASRVIKIAGRAGTPLVYNETSVVYVKGLISLVGSGAGEVVISGGGPCNTSTCVVVFEGGGSIEGVTIDAGPSIGLALGPTVGTTATARKVTVTNGTTAGSAGIYVNGAGSVDLGPDVRAKNNAGTGLLIETIVSAKVNGVFNDNFSGIVIRGGRLNLEGGQALRNKLNGVSLQSDGLHTISNFDARDNVNGVIADASANLTMRSTTLVKNRIGLVFRFGTSNKLDLGTLADNGNNIFGGPSAYNTKAGICLPTPRIMKSNAVGNKWLVCEPTRVQLTGPCEGISSYQDVHYAVNLSTDRVPLDFSACDPGP